MFFANKHCILTVNKYVTFIVVRKARALLTWMLMFCGKQQQQKHSGEKRDPDEIWKWKLLLNTPHIHWMSYLKKKIKNIFKFYYIIKHNSTEKFLALDTQSLPKDWLKPPKMRKCASKNNLSALWVSKSSASTAISVAFVAFTFETVQAECVSTVNAD